MKIYPAIDLRGGRVVRLTRGDYDQTQTYAIPPAEAARGFKAQGARCLHVVDLDGAKEGVPQNAETIRALTGVGLFTEVGGGIRDEARVAEYLENGVSRVILGTVAVRNYAFVEQMAAKYGPAIAVGVDLRDGLVAVAGWRETTALDGVDFCRRLADSGVQTVIATDIARDGMLQGASLPLYEALNAIPGLHVIASGGVSSREDIRALKAIGVSGAIVGKALYEGLLTLKDCLDEAGEGEA